MVSPEQGEQRTTVPEVLGILDVKNRERKPILTEEVVDRIRQALGVAEPVEPVEKMYSTRWQMRSPSGFALDLTAYFTRFGRVTSADILAHDEVGVVYKQGEVQRIARMTGISRIVLLAGDNGAQVVQFIQATDKRSSRIEVSGGNVSVFDHSSVNRSLPLFFVRNFSFRVL